MYQLTEIIPFNKLPKMHKRYITLASEQAVKSDFFNFKVGSCLNFSNSCHLGHNSRRTKAGNCIHTSIHAEICSILNYLRIMDKNRFLRKNHKKPFSSSVLYVVRVTKDDNKYGMSMPCKNCQFYLSKYPFL